MDAFDKELLILNDPKRMAEEIMRLEELEKLDTYQKDIRLPWLKELKDELIEYLEKKSNLDAEIAVLEGKKETEPSREKERKKALAEKEAERKKLKHPSSLPGILAFHKENINKMKNKNSLSREGLLRKIKLRDDSQQQLDKLKAESPDKKTIINEIESDLKELERDIDDKLQNYLSYEIDELAERIAPKLTDEEKNKQIQEKLNEKMRSRRQLAQPEDEDEDDSDDSWLD